MNNVKKIIPLLLALPAAIALGDTPQLGVMPVPVLTGVGVSTSVTKDPSTGIYTYSYTITNPSGNSGHIVRMLLDMTAPQTYTDSLGSILTLPRGGGGNETFDTVQRKISRPDLPMNFSTVAFGITAPPSWIGTLTVNGTGGWAAVGDAQIIGPGQTMSGFSMLSAGVPTIKAMHLEPYWILDMGGDNEPTAAQEIQAYQIHQSTIDDVYVLAPSWVPSGYFDNYDELQRDVTTAIQIGWIADPTLGKTIQQQLQTVRNLYNTEGPDYNTSVALQTLQNTVAAATPGQLTQDGNTLLTLNLAELRNSLGNPTPAVPPAPPPPQPEVTITIPASRFASYDVGTNVSVTANVVDLAQNDAPLSNWVVAFNITSGPDAGMSANAISDQNGNATFSFMGKNIGSDLVVIQNLYPNQHNYSPVRPQIVVRRPTYDSATIVFTGGADLIVKTFTPPELNWDGSSPVLITDTTKNIGNAPADPSVTRYYLSTTWPVDVTTAAVVGERQVPALAPGQSDYFQATYTLISTAGGTGVYYLTACANPDHVVGETNYANNCEIRQVMVPAKQTSQPPNCSGAGPTIASLWPPNHKFVSVGIMGVTDPQGFALTTAITSIQQDEPVDVPGSGNTGPDGAGVGTPIAQLRPERSGTGTGRIYFVGFTATNTANLSCNGTVQVYVPHDKGQGTVPVDTGQRYDSTKP